MFVVWDIELAQKEDPTGNYEKYEPYGFYDSPLDDYTMNIMVEWGHPYKVKIYKEDPHYFECEETNGYIENDLPGMRYATAKEILIWKRGQ